MRDCRLDARMRERWPGDPVAWAIAPCVLMLGIAGFRVAAASIVAAAGAGALLVLRRRLLALALAGALLAASALLPTVPGSVGHWSLTVVLAAVAVLRQRSATATLDELPQGASVAAMMLAALCIAVTATGVGSPATAAAVLVGSACAVLVGARLTQRLAAADMPSPAMPNVDGPSADGPNAEVDRLGEVARHLLLGRITGGMLHDLAQPLNVISMANGNLAYGIEHLDLDEADKAQLLERTERIALQTDRAADILALFRNLGREGNRDGSVCGTVRDALDRATAATQSSLRHPVAVTLEGDALDRPVRASPATLELLAVAILLSALGAFLDAERRSRKGGIVFRAEATSTHVVVETRCYDEAGELLVCKPVDDGGRRLLEQLSSHAGGRFQCLPDPDKPTRLVLRLGHGAA